MDRNGSRIGIAQMRAVRGDVPGNLQRIADMVDRAESQRVDQLVFPELALTGYLVDRRFAESAIMLDGPEIARLRELSRRVSIAVGLIEETSTALFYNSAVFLEHGRISHVHRKIYLPTYGMFDERRYFAAGWDVSAFDTDQGRAAMLICGDAWHIPLAYIAAHDGADILMILAASSNEGLTDTTPCEDAWHWMCRSYALTLSCFVVFANLAGNDDEFHFWGGSFIAGPDGNIIAQSQSSEDDLVVADVKLSTLRRQRIKLPFRRDDSIAHTISLAQRVMKTKIKRDRFFDGEKSEYPAAPKPR